MIKKDRNMLDNGILWLYIIGTRENKTSCPIHAGMNQTKVDQRKETKEMLKRSNKLVVHFAVALLLLAVGPATILWGDDSSLQMQGSSGRIITSPFGVASPDGDGYSEGNANGVEGNSGKIITSPFGVPSLDGEDYSEGTANGVEGNSGKIITSPFGVPASSDIDTGVDVVDNDEEYQISLPEDESKSAEDEVNEDGTSDDVKELEEESPEDTTAEKYIPVKDNPIRGGEYESFNLSLTGISGDLSVFSETDDINNAPTLYVPTGGSFTLTLTANPNQPLPTNFQATVSFSNIIQNGIQNPFIFQQSGSNSSYQFIYSVPSTVYEGTHSVSISCTFNGVTVVRVLKIEIVYFNLKINYNDDEVIDDNDVYTPNSFGKIIHINNLDVDHDGIPDYADGFECSGYINGANNSTALSENSQSSNNSSLSFEKIKIRVSKGLDVAQWGLSFDYDKSDLDVNVYQYNGSTNPVYRTYEPRGNGTIRLWKKDGDEARSRNAITGQVPGDFIPSNVNDNIPLVKFADNRIENNNYAEYTIYIEAVKPLNETANIGDSINVSLKKGNNSNNSNNSSVKFDDEIVVTPYQVVFEGITNDTFSGGTHTINYNPCSLEKGGYGKFHFTTIPTNIPDSNFSWKSSATLRFISGQSIEKSVYVQADNNANVYWLKIDIGRGDNNPKIEGEILEGKTVNLYIWIVADNADGDTPAFQTSEVYSWVSHANDVYKQVGIVFHMEEINYIKKDYYNNIDLQSIQDNSQAKELTGYPQDIAFQRGPGLEIFFVKQLHALGLSIRGPNGGDKTDGIIVAKKDKNNHPAYPRTLPHELGHACGLKDIYVHDSLSPRNYIDNTINVNSLWIKDEDYTYRNTGNANNVMSATGYYKYNLKHNEIIKKLLMNGYQSDESNSIDISGNYVFGYDAFNVKKMIKTGLKDMNRTPTHTI